MTKRCSVHLKAFSNTEEVCFTIQIGQNFPLSVICSCDTEEINLSGMSRSLVSSRIIRYGVGRSVSWPGRTFTWQIFCVENIWWLDHYSLWLLFADIWLAQKEISREVMLTASSHPVVEADDRPLLNVALGKQALPCPWDAALTNLLIHKLINYFEAKGAAQLCFWGKEKINYSKIMFHLHKDPLVRICKEGVPGEWLLA